MYGACVVLFRQIADVTSVNIALCQLVTYFTPACNRGDDVTSDGGVARQPWQQPVMQFVARQLLPSSRRHGDSQYLQQTFGLISRLFTLNISAGMSAWKCPPLSMGF